MRTRVHSPPRYAEILQLRLLSNLAPAPEPTNPPVVERRTSRQGKADEGIGAEESAGMTRRPPHLSADPDDEGECYQTLQQSSLPETGGRFAGYGEPVNVGATGK